MDSQTKSAKGLNEAVIIQIDPLASMCDKTKIVQCPDHECQIMASPATGASFTKPKHQQPFLFAGYLASILGSIFFSMSILCVKLMPTDNDNVVIQTESSGLIEKTRIIWYRGLILMALSSAIQYFYVKSSVKVCLQDLPINILRAMFAFMACYGAYVSLQFISMGDSTALVFSSPIWTSILSHYILSEPLQWIQLVALPASLFGIVLIAHPALIIPMDHEAGASERQPFLLPPEWEAVVSLDSASNHSLLHNISSIFDSILTNINNNQYADSFIGTDGTNDGKSAVATTITELFSQEQANEFESLINNITKAITVWNQDLDASTNAHEHYDLEHRWPGIAIALVTSFLVSGQYIVFRLPTGRTSIQTTIFWIGTTTLFTSTVILGAIGGNNLYQLFLPQNSIELLLLVANGLFSWLGQGLLQWALCHEDASILSVVRTLDVAMTFGLSAVFLDEQILWTSIVGASIIAMVVVVVMLNNWWSKRSQKSNKESKS